MSKIIELRNKRNTLWEQTKAFLEEHRDANGLVEASAVEQYNKMASDVKALGDEIARLEDQMEMDAKLSAATSAPVHADPKPGRKANVSPTATAEYGEAFWNMMRGHSSPEVCLSALTRTAVIPSPTSLSVSSFRVWRRITSSVPWPTRSTQTPAPASSRWRPTPAPLRGSRKALPFRSLI